MANELREYLESLGLREDAIERAVELATPDSFRADLAALGGENKDLKTELSELRPLKEAPQRKAALEPFGHDYDTAPKYLKSVFDQIPADKLSDADFISEHLRDNDVEVKAPEKPAGERPKAAAIVEHSVQTGQVPVSEDYDAAVKAAQSQEELDAVYEKFGKQPAVT